MPNINEVIALMVDEAVSRATTPLEKRIKELEHRHQSSGMFKTMDAAKEMHISYNTLIKYVRQGMPFHQMEGTRYFDIEESSNWIKEHKN
ncbi:hypothetical protein D0499_05220 [Weissella soli]|uniref:hypothetical protein n=1 Tax=Weissella soli TaxID=155866 RepID=UPI0021BE6629|nr:hypothetical protein [Weissella soli]MCT8395211.1 hypothetical protein [Weissella soli]